MQSTSTFRSLPAFADSLADLAIAIVIPAYNEERHIADVLAATPPYVRYLIVVDDASTDRTADVLQQCAESDSRVLVVRHEHNQGVGGAMVTGFLAALTTHAQIIVKMDGDGQMSADYLPRLCWPLATGKADFAKGNRFQDFDALRQMPPLRRAGNMALSFCTKAAVGYWKTFDPCNGFVAIRRDVLERIELQKLHRSYFFESSLLAELYLTGAVVQDVAMPACYRDEESTLSIRKVLVEFPPKLCWCLVRRLVLKNFLYDFSLESVYLLCGLPLLLLGALYGGGHWIYYGWQSIPAPTGTVVISALLITIGFQLTLSAVGEDVRSVPVEPLGSRPAESPQSGRTLEEQPAPTSLMRVPR